MNDFFTLNEPLDVKFKLNIDGTSAKPSNVYVVLGSEPCLRFTAKYISDSNEWCASVIPFTPVISAGDVQLCINVLLAGKFYTVVKRTIYVADQPTTTVDFIQSTNAHRTEIQQVEEPVVDEPVVALTAAEPEVITVNDVPAATVTANDISSAEVTKQEPQVNNPSQTDIAVVINTDVDDIEKEDDKKQVIDLTKITETIAQPKRISLDFKSINVAADKTDKKKPEVKSPITVTEVKTNKLPFKVKKGKVVIK